MPFGRVSKHRLLERRERARLDHVRRHRPGKASNDERGQPAGERERGPRYRHEHEEEPVEATPTDAVAVASHEDGDNGDSAEERRQDRSDRGVREPAVCECYADQDRAESICDRSCSLRGDDATRV